MPNEFKPLRNASALAPKTKKSSQQGSSTVSMTLWTISGIVLAACTRRDWPDAGAAEFPNNAPVLNTVTGATITDNAASDAGSTVTTGSLTGTLAGTDADTGDTLTYQAVRGAVTGELDTGEGDSYTHSVVGTYGKFYYHNTSGAYTFIRDEAAINAVGAGDNVNDTFTVSVSDGSLTSATRDLVFNVDGANDAPVLNAVTGATITDNANSDTGSTVAGSLTGTLAGTDADAGDTLVFAATNATDDTSKTGYDHRVDGTYGNLYYNEGTGAYIFERDEAAINALDSGQNVNDTFTVSVSDQGGASSATRDLVFTVEGVNDAPVLNAVTGATITDNATLSSTVTTGSLTGSLSGTDVDAGDAAGLTFAASTAADNTSKSGYDHRVDGTYGNLYYNEGSGAYIFERDEAAINELNAGQNVNDTFTVSVSDGNLASATRDLVFTVNGANDAPVQAANTATTLNEGGMVTLVEANLRFTDADNTRAQVVYVITEVPDHGELRLNGTALTANATFTDAQISSDAVTYHHDGSENHNDDFSFRVENQDGSGTALTTAIGGVANVFTHSFTVTAVNDTPVLNAVTGATITDNATSDTGSTVAGSLTGTLAGTDADGDTLVFAVNGATDNTSKSGYDHRVDGSYGNLYYNEGSGAYIFERDEAAINALNATQNVNDTFIVRATDPGGLTSATRDLVFTVNGANDAPVLNTVTGATITDNAASDTGSTVAGSLTGTLAGTDVDAGDAAGLTFAASNATDDTSKTGYDHRVGGTYGTFYYNEGSGAYIFERDEAAINALDSGQNVNDTFTVSVSDQGGASSATRDLVFTVEGVNDAPVLNAVTGAIITDNTNSDTGSTVAGSFTGTLAGTDVDAGDAASLTFAASTAADNTSKSGYDHRVDGTYGDFYYNEGSGAYIFERDEAAINALNVGQNVNDSFTVSVSDGGLTSATRDLIFIVIGRSDRPVLEAVTGATINDNANSDTGSTVTTGSLTGSLVGSDADAGDAAGLTFAASNAADNTSQTGYDHRVDGTYGDLYYNEGTGAYIFERDEAAINALATGQNVNDTFTVSVSDQGGASSATRDLVFTVVGVDETNTAPTLNAVTGATITDSSMTGTNSRVNTGDLLTGTLVGTDADGDTLTYVVTGGNSIADTTRSSTHRIDGTYGEFYYHEGNGSYTFIRDEVAINTVGAGVTMNDTFTVSVSDGSLTSATRDLVFTVVGADDPLTLPGPSRIVINDIENSASSSTVSSGSLTGNFGGIDVDGDTILYGSSNATPDTRVAGFTRSFDGLLGTFYYNHETGAYEYVRKEAAINALAEGGSTNLSIRVTATSDAAPTEVIDRILTFRFEGANDAPTLATLTGATITDNSGSATISTVAGSLTGTLSGADVDGNALTYAASNAVNDTTGKSGYDHRVDGTYGDLYYNEGTGAYEFERDEAAINALNAGQTMMDTFTFSVSDGTLTSDMQDLVFNVIGTDL